MSLGGLSLDEVKLYEDSLTSNPRGDDAPTVAFVSKFQAADLRLGCLIGDKVRIWIVWQKMQLMKCSAPLG